MSIVNGRILNPLFCKTISLLCSMTLTLSILFAESALASTYFLSPTGSDANAGTSSEAPWKTFDYAFAQTVCGDTLMAMDGTYTMATNTQPYILSRNCTPSAPFTIKAVNERKAHIHGDGCTTTFLINRSAYIVLDGLTISSQMNASCTAPNAILIALDSHHLTIKNTLYFQANRYANFIMQSFTRVTDSLTEDSEAYDFHRHAFGNDNSDRNVYRRLYCQDRGPVGGDSGDGCVTWYPGSDNIAENIISEGDSYVTDIQALGLSQNNKVFGSVGIGSTQGAFGSYKCRSHDLPSSPDPTNMPVNNTLQDIVYIGHPDSYGFGLTFRGTRNTQVKHASIFNPSKTNYGFSADVESINPCAPPYSVFIENSFVQGANATATPYGFVIAKQTSWSLTNTSASGNTTNYYPAPPSANHVNAITTNPAMSPCYLWIPNGSPMKGAGTGGSDIGATILYRYQNGTITNTPLWDPATGRFPCRAVVPGINDLPGSSCNDVHKRLNVNANGCTFPSSYAQARDATAPSPPQNVAVR